ncbi:hypothetical protein OE88DRAFT_1662716 [Heliocybe sulcata]|uniref:Uncharacterized protein n=1 Tax=Heliocybe sulcata TaxID=5364 RepID=A0A5C3MWD7_9AGAM|nr:hypothetical protein OE88DRAFT_1662716 [Heliocybe sulcata]
MFSSTLVFALCFFSAVAAAPSSVSSLPGCSGLGANASNTLASFTLAALNTSLPNANSTGAPLVLGQAGAIDGATFEVLSTWATFPYNDWPTLSLVNGGLYGNSSYGNQAVSSGATNGTTVGFITTTPTPTPSQVFCIVPNKNSSGLPLLALNGHTDEFSLCSNGKGYQNNVAYNASGKSYYYDYTTCYPVVLQVVGTQ